MKQKHFLAEKENYRMRNELRRLTESINNKEDEDLILENYQLTERQLEIIELVKLGKTNKEIGMELYISENTVKYHLKSIYQLLGIDNRLELK